MPRQKGSELQDALSVPGPARAESTLVLRSEAQATVLLIALHTLFSWPSLYLYRYAADVPAVYLASGVAWAGFMLLGPRAQLWFGAGIVVSQLVGEFVVYESSVTMALTFTVSRTLGAWLGTVLLQRAIGHRVLRPTVPDLLWFGGIACLVVPLVIMVPPHIVRVIEFDLAPYWFFTLILIEAGGVVVMAPMLLFWLQPQKARISDSRAEAFMITVAAAAAFAVVYLVPPGYIPQHTAFYAVTPVMIWAAVRFGCRGAALISLVLTLVMVGSALAGLGPFSDKSDLVLSVIELEIFIVVVTGMSLLLGAYAEAREASQQRRASDKRRLQQLSMRLLQSEERYRDRLATRLHDGVGQTLSLGRMRLDDLMMPPVDPQTLASRIAPIQNAFDTAINQVRDMTRDVAAGLYRGDDIAAAVHQHVSGIFEGSGVETTVHSEAIPELPHEVAVVISRAIRECLVNIAKHAEATRVSVELTAAANPGSFVASIIDDGRGFDASQLRMDDTRDTSFGLASVRNSMLALGGAFEIDSAAGRGTEVTLTLPLAGGAPG